MANAFVQYIRGAQNAPGERKLVQKLDFFILTFCCLMYFLNYLDRTNLNNAYVSGMKEDLKFHGNQLNQINTVFTVGYTVGQVPCNIALYYVKPRIFFPTCMVRLPLLVAGRKLMVQGCLGGSDKGHGWRSQSWRHYGDSVLPGMTTLSYELGARSLTLGGYFRSLDVCWNALHPW
jgi:hypothetical protein